ncbi:MAG: hypothetical protein PUI81_10255, partial [Veillonellaceae bacterium]|nr:hypothetical protein [Veillonellaceae bacterium]
VRLPDGCNVVNAHADIQEAVTRAKGTGEWLTDFYIAGDRLENWIQKGEIRMCTIGKTAFILRERPAFWQTYFVSPDKASLAADLKAFLSDSDEKLAIFTLGNVDELHETIENAGMRFYTGLDRVSKFVKEVGTPRFADNAELAISGDGVEIQQIMFDTLDPYSDQIPDIDEIEKMITNQSVIVIRNQINSEIEAVYCWTRQGIANKDNYLMSREKYRKQFVGIKIMDAYFAYAADVKRHTGWIRDNNIASKLVNDRFGFKADGFRQEVFVYNI